MISLSNGPLPVTAQTPVGRVTTHPGILVVDLRLFFVENFSPKQPVNATTHKQFEGNNKEKPTNERSAGISTQPKD